MQREDAETPHVSSLRHAFHDLRADGATEPHQGGEGAFAPTEVLLIFRDRHGEVEVEVGAELVPDEHQGGVLGPVRPAHPPAVGSHPGEQGSARGDEVHRAPKDKVRCYIRGRRDSRAVPLVPFAHLPEARDHGQHVGFDVVHRLLGGEERHACSRGREDEVAQHGESLHIPALPHLGEGTPEPYVVGVARERDQRARESPALLERVAPVLLQRLEAPPHLRRDGVLPMPFWVELPGCYLEDLVAAHYVQVGVGVSDEHPPVEREVQRAVLAGPDGDHAHPVRERHRAVVAQPRLQPQLCHRDGARRAELEEVRWCRWRGRLWLEVGGGPVRRVRAAVAPAVALGSRVLGRAPYRPQAPWPPIAIAGRGQRAPHAPRRLPRDDGHAPRARPLAPRHG